MATKPSLTLVRRIKAPPVKVFADLTKPEQLVRWWNPGAGPVLSAEADVRPGGRFHIVFRTQDGGEHFSSGEYLEVVLGERLVFTWERESQRALGSIVTIVLRPITGGTELTLTHAQFPNEAERDIHRDGWSGAFDKLEAFLRSSEESRR